MRSVLNHRQQGAVAIETAIILPIMVIILIGLFVFWQALQAQQVLTRATGDAARAAHGLIVNGTVPCPADGYTGADASRTLIRSQIEALVYSSLAIHMPGGRRAEIEELAEISEFEWTCGKNEGQVTWQVSYQMPLLLGPGLVALIGFDEIKELTESSTVHFQLAF
ncbi:MAG: pilus assembly protein [Pseudomonas sp.]